MDFSLFKNRKIINVLIGDAEVIGRYKMPYLSGPKLCEMSTRFGLATEYSSESRWKYMYNLIDFLNKNNQMPLFLKYLFDISNLKDVCDIDNPEQIKQVHAQIIEGAIQCINAELLFSKCKLVCQNSTYRIVNLEENLQVEAPQLSNITHEYIRNLPFRIHNDFINGNYDSVVTKSRTLLEEVLIYVIEKKTNQSYENNGNLIHLYCDATGALCMTQNGDWDKRVNELLGGLNKIVNAIARMRNINSDAHGVGNNRIDIHESEAMLIVNSSMMISEYLLGVLGRSTSKNDGE